MFLRSRAGRSVSVCFFTMPLLAIALAAPSVCLTIEEIVPTTAASGPDSLRLAITYANSYARIFVKEAM